MLEMSEEYLVDLQPEMKIVASPLALNAKRSHSRIAVMTEASFNGDA